MQMMTYNFNFNFWSHWRPPTTVRPWDLHTPLPLGLPVEKLIPPPTSLSPGELLEMHYAEKRREDERRELERRSEAQDRPADDLDPPRSAVDGKGPRPSARAVPAPEARSVDASRVVAFRDRDDEGPSRGIHVAALCGEGADPGRLRGARDVVLDDLRGSALEFVIAWPGYPAQRLPIRVVSQTGRPLTRFDLGERVSIAYAIFFKKVEREGLRPSYPASAYEIALHQGENQRADSLGVQFMRLHLVRFRRTVAGMWVADVDIV